MHKIAGFFIGLAVGVSILATFAHSPCDDRELECRWELVVSSITGETKEVYICK